MSEQSSSTGGAVVATFSGNPPAPQPNADPQAPGNEAQRHQAANREAGAHLYGDGTAREALTAEFGRLKQELASGNATAAARKNFREVRDALYFGGETPESMRSTMQADPGAPYDSGFDTFRGAYEPGDPSQYKSIASLDGRLSTDQAQSVKDIAGALGLPAQRFKGFEERVAHHMQETGRLEPVDEAHAGVWLETLAQAYGGDTGKAVTQMNKARNYVERVLSPAQLKDFDDTISGTSLAWDPLVLNALASMYDVHLGGGE